MTEKAKNHKSKQCCFEPNIWSKFYFANILHINWKSGKIYYTLSPFKSSFLVFHHCQSFSFFYTLIWKLKYYVVTNVGQAVSKKRNSTDPVSLKEDIVYCVKTLLRNLKPSPVLFILDSASTTTVPMNSRKYLRRKQN